MYMNALVAVLLSGIALGGIVCGGVVLVRWTRARISRVVGEFRGLSDHVESRLGSVESRLGSVEGRLGSVEGRLGSVEGRFEKVERRLESADERLANLRRATARDYVERLLPRPNSPRRSVLFVHYHYYHFLYLAQALRRRGWDAFAISLYPPNYADQWLMHGEDACLFSHDAEEFGARLQALHWLIQDRFRMVHFAGVGHMSLFAENFNQTLEPDGEIPWDFAALKAKGIKIGYSTSGCNDGIRQSVFKKHKNACAKCIWELYPDVCSDERNAAWGDRLVAACDLVSTDKMYGNEWLGLPIVHREPLTTALNPDLWSPDLEVPDGWRLPRGDGEMIVLHGFGNSESRRIRGRDIKGTGAVISAIDRLRAEGLNVRLENPTTVHSRDMRFLQVQADVIVDQLVLGRYGAQAREGLMLGKPTVCHIDRREPPGVSGLGCLAECPLVDATEETVYGVLKRLLLSEEERKRIGRASRAYAVKWHGADNVARRFERIYDRMMAGQPLNISGSELDGVR